MPLPPLLPPALGLPCPRPCSRVSGAFLGHNLQAQHTVLSLHSAAAVGRVGHGLQAASLHGAAGALEHSAATKGSSRANLPGTCWPQRRSAPPGSRGRENSGAAARPAERQGGKSGSRAGRSCGSACAVSSRAPSICQLAAGQHSQQVTYDRPPTSTATQRNAEKAPGSTVRKPHSDSMGFWSRWDTCTGHQEQLVAG